MKLETTQTARDLESLLRSSMTTDVMTAAKILGLSRLGAYRAVAAGHIPSLRVGKKILIPTKDLLRMVGREAA